MKSMSILRTSAISVPPPHGPVCEARRSGPAGAVVGQQAVDMLTLLRLVPRGLREPAAPPDGAPLWTAGSGNVTGECTRPVTAPGQLLVHRGRYHTDRQRGAALQNTAICPAGPPVRAGGCTAPTAAASARP